MILIDNKSHKEFKVPLVTHIIDVALVVVIVPENILYHIRKVLNL